MAGDHKCPVCQSTFTRPQHVARHMRSHTGDRPYKCQHCGDQFARSDLLSRHVNKCHASEKPPTTTAPNRRKGSAAASRATTSKQACDQCVTSSLPCDGSNPCSKCIQRKCRCTYVKFHRQTMPQGPGHPVPNQMPPGGRSMLPGSSRLPEDFVLAPPQSSFAFPSLYTANGGDYSLPPTSSLYPTGFANPADHTASNAALALPSGTSPELMARYRAQADMLSRLQNQPVALSAVPGAAPADSVMSNHALYNESQAQASLDRYSLPMPAANHWGQETQPQHSFRALDEHRKDYSSSFAGARESFPARDSSATTRANEPSLQTHPTTYGSTFPPLSSTDGSAGNYHGAGVYQHQRAGSLSDDFSSDGGSNSANNSHSLPGSAHSSSVHLPLPEQCQGRPTYALPGFTHLDPSSNSNSSNSQSNSLKNRDPVFSQDGQGEGGFSSAFGLMSLDDPNVLAGLASDSAPFFSNLTSGAPGLSLPTPTQDLIAALKTGRSDGDNKEMRDFWKMYVRTPLSGPGSNNGLSLATPTGPGQVLGGGRPSPTRRHSRVASLPSIKTPTALVDSNTRFPLNFPNISARNQRGQEANQSREQRHDGQNAFSNVRTTLHDADDLKSYEQAVLARKTPINLNLVPKRRGTLPTGASPPGGPEPHEQHSKASSASPNMPHLPPFQPTSNKIPDLLNRPSSTTSTNSSLAHAFGLTDGMHAGSRPTSQSGPQLQNHAMRPPSGESASTTAVGSDAGTDSDSCYRPSFKRLASQTLGPENAKRALLGPAGWDDDAVDEDDDDGDFGQQRSLSAGADEGAIVANKNGATYNRPVVSLPDRHRRASAPTGDMPPPLGRMDPPAATS